MDVRDLESAIEEIIASSGPRSQYLNRLIGQYEGVPVDEHFIRRYDHLFDNLCNGRRRVATTDPWRHPTDSEVVVCYGNYPPTVNSLCFANPIRRPVEEFFHDDLTYDAVEHHDCWDSVDRIIYINLQHRSDRRHGLLWELARLQVPLDRVEHLAGISCTYTTSPQVNGAIGCLLSHLEACRRLQDEGAVHALVLEDDFIFIDDSRQVQANLSTFFQRRYQYDLCLLATSKVGSVEPVDDLVCCTRQVCTNSSSYLVSADGLDRLIPCLEEAVKGLERTGDILTFAIDRYWARLQGERFLLFNQKPGFQRPSFSDIEQRIAAYND